LLSFPELEDINVLQATFGNLVFNRKTAHYREAMEISAMLLLNYRPDISTGQNHVLAILFDMNDLWEEYIYRQLFRSKPAHWLIKSQNSKQFWQLKGSNSSKTIRPDIIIHNTINDTRVVLDTKWKLPDNNIPTDADLKQMFVYNEYWQGNNALLVYPNATFTNTPIHIEGVFKKKSESSSTHSCGVIKMAVLDKTNQKLDSTNGRRMIDFLKKKILE
jgi:5-methylcytosine-specific restriction enzyme subunit McrC